MAEAYRSVEVPGFGDVDFPASMTDDEVAEAIRRNVLKEPAAPLSPLQPPGPAFSTEVPGLVQGEVGKPLPPPAPTHGLIASTVKAAGFPGAAATLEKADQYLPGKAKEVATVAGKGLESLGGVGSALAAATPLGLAGALTNPTQPLAGATGALRGAWEDAMPAFLSAENLTLMALSHGTGAAAQLARTAKMDALGVAPMMAGAARLGEVGEVAKYAKELERLEAQVGRAAMLAKLGSIAETSFALGYGTKGGIELWEAAKKGDWKGVAQAGMSLMMAGGLGAAAKTHLGAAIKPGPRTATEPFLKEARHEELARPLRAEYSLEALTEKRIEDVWGQRAGVNALGPGEPVPGLSPEVRGEIAQQARADMLSKGRQPIPGEAVPGTGNLVPGGIQGVEETLQIAQEAETARRLLDLVERGQLVLPPEGVAALQADAARGIQPPAAPQPPGEAPPGGPVPAGVVERPVPLTPSDQPVVGGVLPLGERFGPTPGFEPFELKPPLVRGVQEPRQGPPEPRAGVGAPLPPSKPPRAPRGAVGPRPAAGKATGAEVPAADEAVLGTQRARELAATEARMDYEGKRQRLLSVGSDAERLAVAKSLSTEQAREVIASLDAAPGDSPAARRAIAAAHPELATRGTALGEAPPGVSPEAPTAATGEPPPTSLDVAADAASARLKASAGLKGEGPTEAHTGLSTQNLRDMATVAAAKLARAGKPMTRESWEADFKAKYGKTPGKEVMDRIWEVSQDAAALGRAAGPRVAQAYAEEMAGPPRTKRVQQALGLEDEEGALAARVNNHFRSAITQVENATIGFQLKGSQVEQMRQNLDKLVATGHMGREEQAAFAAQGTAPRSQTEKLPISEASFAKTLGALETTGAHIEKVLTDLRTSGIPIDATTSGLRVGAGFRGSDDLRTAINVTLENLFSARGDFARAAKALAVTKSTWARIGHRQQEALRLTKGLQDELNRIPGAMERLKTAGLELRGIQMTHFRKPWLSEMGEILGRGFSGGSQDVLAFLDDYRRGWRTQFSLRSFIMDVTSDAASFAREVPAAIGHDAWLAIRGQDMTAPQFRSFLDAARTRFGKESFRPVPGGVEEGLGMTAYAEPLRPGTPPPADAGWLKRAWHAAHREGAAGEATYRTGNTMATKALSVILDEGAMRGLYLKAVPDTFTKRFFAHGYILKRAVRAGNAKGLTGADLKAFVENYQKNPLPPEVKAEAIRRGSDAGFNQELSSFERRWFRDNPWVQYMWDAFPGWALQHSRWLRDTLGYNIYKAYKNPAEAGVFKEAEIAGAVGQALAGWGALVYVKENILPYVDPETGDLVDKITGYRMPLRGIEPLATLVTLGYFVNRDWKSAGNMLPYSSIPGGGALGDPGGGIAGGPWHELKKLLHDPSLAPEQFTNRLVNVLNRGIPERPALEVLKAFTDPISRRGFGSPLPGYSKTLPAVIDPATGKPRQPRYELPIITDILKRMGLAGDFPAFFGTQTPGAKRIVDPVEKLLERFGVPSSAAKQVPGIYRNISSLPGNLSTRDLSQAQRDKHREFYGQERQRILGPWAKRYDELDQRARKDEKFALGVRAQLEALDAAADRSAVHMLLQTEPTLRPTGSKREPPYTGPYADRPGYGTGSPVP